MSVPAFAGTFQSAVFSFDHRLQRAIRDLREGRAVIVVDDFDRENEADLVATATSMSVETMALFIREGSGIVCLCLTEETLDRLELPQMVSTNESCYQTAFTVTIDAREGTTTGVSAQDRLTTVRAAVARDAKPYDLVRPGHMFPLRAAAGGLLERRGHTEASVALARLAGLLPAGVICEMTNEDGSMAQGVEVERFAKRSGMVVLSVSELVTHLSCSAGDGARMLQR